MSRGFVLCLAAIVAAVPPPTAEGAGFQVYPDQSAAAMGQAAAVVARSGLPSAVFYNPAAITTLEGTHLELGLSGISLRTTYVSSETGTAGQRTGMSKDPSAIPSLHLTRHLAERITVGLGLNAPYGTQTDWSSTWEGRYYADRTSLVCGYLSPTISFEVHPGLSLGAAPLLAWGDVTIERAINAPLVFAVAAPPLAQAFTAAAFTPENDIQTRLKGDGWGFGMRLGFYWQWSSRLSLGGCFQSEVPLALSGRATYQSPKYEDEDFGGAPSSGAMAQQIAAVLFPTSNIDAHLHLPATLSGGIAYSLTDDIVLETDLLWTGWSAYKDLSVTYERLASGEDTTSTTPKNWKDVLALRMGAEVDLTRRLVGRLGCAFDWSPTPDDTRDPSLPCADQLNLAIGLAHRFTGWTLDAAYVYTDVRDADSRLQVPTNGDLLGIYETTAHTLTLGARIQF